MRWRLGLEYLLLFFGLVGGYALIGSPGSPIPFLLVGAIGAWWYLRRSPTFDRATFWRWSAVRPALPWILAGWLITAVLVVLLLAVWAPERLFRLPREQPLLAVVIAVFYPLFSVYPQELIFRAFLLARYAPVFGARGWAVAASAAAFGFAHIIYGTLVSVVITLVGGAVFAYRYRQTASLAAVWVEHSLYGVLAFTVGLGDLFYHGALRT
jgi:membrane protease YdiL (CAAX protease family)